MGCIGDGVPLLPCQSLKGDRGSGSLVLIEFLAAVFVIRISASK